MKLSDEQIGTILHAEEKSALDYVSELGKDRDRNMRYYNCEPYGDEVEGQSSAVTSDVSDTIEWMLPSFIRTFTQGKLIAKFESSREEDDEEAEQKTHLSNYAFMHENNGTLTLHNMFKDALLQYTGVVKVYWDEREDVKTTNYEGLSELELQALMSDESIKVGEVSQSGYGTYNAESVSVTTTGRVGYDNIPPEEFLISKSARDFINPRFIGHRSPKTRSDLIEMGFDDALVASLPADEYYENSLNRARGGHDSLSSNPANHSPNDIIYLGEHYIQVDVDGDGITELWKVFYAGNKVLEKEQVDDHPFAVCVPIPIPHRAIGTCPADQVCPLQYRKSVMVRHLNDNVYQNNYNRIAHSNMVDLDDLLTPRAGGGVGVDTDNPDVAGHIAPIMIQDMSAGIMASIEYIEGERETRTGVTRYSQGLDGEALNKTATGFRGIMDASQQRLDMIARIFADGGVKEIFKKTVSLMAKHQDTAMQKKVLGEPMEINPKEWGDNTNCRVDVGLGSGDRQEKILNLNNILQIQERFMASGMVLSDQPKLYSTLEKLIDEVGLKDVNEYFNNPEVPQETLYAQNQQMQAMIQQLQQVAGDPYMQAEQMKAQARLLEAQGKGEIEAAKMIQNQKQFDAKLASDMRTQMQEMAAKLTELELKYDQDVPGSSV